MPSANSWNVISGADSNRVILGVDFPVAGRAGAGFAGLMAKLGPEWPEYRFLQTVLPGHSIEKLSADAYTQPWIRDVEQGGWEVTAILGYCVGGVYAASIAESVYRRHQPEPKVILFDPQFADVRVLVAEMQKTFSLIAPLLSQEDLEYVKKRVTELIDPQPTDIADLATALVGVYREVGSNAFRQLGLNEVRANEMIELFESYMSWLSAAAQIDPSHAWGKSIAIVSADYVTLAGQDSSVGAVSNIVSQKIMSPAAHDDMLESEFTVRALLEQMRL